MKSCPTCWMQSEDGATRCRLCHEPLTRRVESPLVEGRYQLESMIGSGSQGIVFLARDVGLGRLVALKMLHSSCTHTLVAAARLKREATALASVHNDHVAQVYSFGSHGDSFFLAMEYVRGRNLELLVTEHSDRRAHIPTLQCRTILSEIADGLTSLHQAGIVHRDVKPSNVMIEYGTERTVLLDLGLARWLSRPTSSRCSIVGTPQYMAPEQINADDSTQIAGHTDVYSLGCTAYELFTGAPPFTCDSVRETLAHQMFDEAPALSRSRPDLAALDPVLQRALCKDPNARYQSCAEMVAAIDEALRDHPHAPGRPPPASLRLMVVDDDEVFRAFAAAACGLALPGIQLETVCAASGVEALQAAERSCPDVVVLDDDMPLLEGAETLSYLRAMPGGFGAQVVVVSSALRQLPRWRFAAMGVSEFLKKPIDLAEFAVVLNALATRALEQRARR